MLIPALDCPFASLDCLFPALSNAPCPALERQSSALESQLLDHPCKSVCVCRIYVLVTAVDQYHIVMTAWAAAL